MTGLTPLMKIQPFIQAYVQAIASILEADVTIVDHELIRVAGTGDYLNEIGNAVSHANFFEKILKTGKGGIIRDVNDDSNCVGCEKRAYCKELANLAYPIFQNQTVVGIISIIAFREQQRKNVLENMGKLEEFLKYMSMLLESKLYTDEAKSKLEEQLKAVHTAESAWSFVGDSPKMQEALRIGRKVAKSDSTVFLRGESGTGKEIMAKMIHDLSDRREKLMISINCAAIPENLVESELFGYEEGAFTGARKHGSVGKFELADKSTIFLDEIGDMPLHLQVKLLRVLQEKTISRIGSTKSIPIDTRIIAATNRNLEEMVQDKTFRQDLYYRLNVVSIILPPLRERKTDIPPLIEHFVNNINEKYRMNKKLSPSMLKCLMDYDWPGNVRELENIIERILVTSEENEIIPKAGLLPWNPSVASILELEADEIIPLKEAYDNLEHTILQNAAKKYKTTYEIAEALQISQPSVSRKLKKHKIKWNE